MPHIIKKKPPNLNYSLMVLTEQERNQLRLMSDLSLLRALQDDGCVDCPFDGRDVIYCKTCPYDS